MDNKLFLVFIGSIVLISGCCCCPGGTKTNPSPSEVVDTYFSNQVSWFPDKEKMFSLLCKTERDGGFDAWSEAYDNRKAFLDMISISVGSVDYLDVVNETIDGTNATVEIKCKQHRIISTHTITKNVSLVKEDNEWKLTKTYIQPCE